MNVEELCACGVAAALMVGAGVATHLFQTAPHPDRLVFDGLAAFAAHGPSFLIGEGIVNLYRENRGRDAHLSLPYGARLTYARF